MRLRAQAGLEYMMLLAMAAIFFALIALYLQQQVSTNIATQQAQFSASGIADAADLLYAHGVGSRTTVRFYVPSGTNYINLKGREVLFKLYGLLGTPTDVYRVTQDNLTPASIPSTTGTDTCTMQFTSDGNITVLDCGSGAAPPTPS